jgi:hypothetical protein
MEATISLNKQIVSNYETVRKSPNIPTLAMLRRSLDEKNELYPYNGDLVFTGENMPPHKPTPDTLTMGLEVIIHQTKKIHLAARKKLTFEGRFMAAPKIILEVQSGIIELIDSGDPKNPVTTIAAQTRLVLSAPEIFLNGVHLKCYDAPIDFRARTIRYANIDFQELQKASTFSPNCKFINCKFMEVEVIDD